MEDSAIAYSLLDSYQLICVGNIVFLAHRGQNKYGRFMKLNEIGNCVIIGHLVIHKESQGCVWVDFAKHVRELVGLKCFVPVSRISGSISTSVDEILILNYSKSLNVTTGTILDSQTHSNVIFMQRY